MKYPIIALLMMLLVGNIYAQSDFNNSVLNKKIKSKIKIVKPTPVVKDGDEISITWNLPTPVLNSKATNVDVERIEIGISAHQRPFRREEAKIISYSPELDAISVVTILNPENYAGVTETGIVGQFYSLDHGQSWEGPIILANDISEGANYYLGGTMFNPEGNTNMDEIIGVSQGTLSPASGDWRFKSFGTSKWSGDNQQNYIYEETNTDYSTNGYWNFYGTQQFGNQIRCMNPKPKGEWSEYTDLDLEIILADYNNGSFDWTHSTVINFDLYNDSEEGNVHWMGNWNGNDSGFEIAWSNDGEIGYAWIVGVDENNASGFQPLIYKTENAGETWSSIHLDFTTSAMQNYLSSYLTPTYNGLYIPYTVESVGAVNINGELEIFAAIGSTSADIFVNRDSVYYRTELPSDLFNLTINSDGIGEISHITKFNTMNVLYDEDGNYCGTGWQHRLFATKSPDETQIMLTWTDTQDGEMYEYNLHPDIYGWSKYNYNGTIVTSENPICFTEGTLYEGFYYFTCAAEFAFEDESGNYTIPYMQAVSPSEFAANTSASSDAVTINYVTGIELPKLGNGVLDLALVEVSPNNQYVSGDDVFETTIEISEVTNLGGFEINLDFDPNYLQANSVSIASFLGSTGRTVLPLMNNIDNANGEIEFAATTLGASIEAPSGAGVLLTIEWTSANVEDAVDTDIVISHLQLTQPNANIIPFEIINGRVEIANCFKFDFDCDCDVDIVDVTSAAYAYGTEEGDLNYDAKYDDDGDGDIDIVDISRVTYNYGWTCDGKSFPTLNTQNSDVDLSINDEYSEIEAVGELNLHISGVEQLGAYELDLSFDPQDIEILEINGGDILNKTERETLELVSSYFIEKGSIQYAITSLGSETNGANGSGELLNIKYRKKSPQASIQFEAAQIARIDGNIIPFTLNQTTGLQENVLASAKVYPNPMKDFLFIEYQIQEAGTVNFELKDMNGKTIFSWIENPSNTGMHQTEMQRKGLDSGTYFLSIKSDKQVWKQMKIIIR